MTTEHALKIIKVLTKASAKLPPPMSALIVRDYGKNPFLILISCLLSLRARDTTTYPVCKKLFARARTPQEIVKLSKQELEKIIYSTGFYHRKAQVLHEVSAGLLKRFNGKVPHTEKELLSLPGVGRKTANLVLAEAFDIPAICVDTHVHRLANKLGLVHTKTPEQTENALKKIVPKKYWKDLNRLLVTWGQQVPRKDQLKIIKELIK